MADEQVLELPLTFSFDYAYNESLSRVDFLSFRLNDAWLNMTDYTASWDPDRRGFWGFCFLNYGYTMLVRMISIIMGALSVYGLT